MIPAILAGIIVPGPFPACRNWFACRCSRERVAGLIRMVGVDEVRQALLDRDAIEVTCEFCGQRYDVSREEAERALADTRGKTPRRA